MRIHASVGRGRGSLSLNRPPGCCIGQLGCGGNTPRLLADGVKFGDEAGGSVA